MFVRSLIFEVEGVRLEEGLVSMHLGELTHELHDLVNVGRVLRV